MCEARVIIRKGDEEKTVMEDAASLHVEDGKLVVRNILGERVEVEGTIEKVDLLSNLIIVRP
ncbi:MAG: CooT family nickel-binding protein [Deltaproteobacteria bacterium]|nr:CooT family nickel-binding protein [Deltaproteobacteria bacterium]